MRKLLTAFLIWLFAASPVFAASGMWVYESGAWKPVSVFETYQSGAWKPVSTGYVYEGGAWKIFYGALAVSASDVSDIVSINVGSCATPVAGPPGTTVSGGSGSYSYSWTYVSGSATPAVSSATAQNPTWSGSLCIFSGGDISADAVWKVTVTDTVTLLTANTSINVHLEYNRP